jgi:hypothetical protein
LSALLLIDIPWFLTKRKLAAIFIKTFSWGFPTGRSFTTSQQVFWHHQTQSSVLASSSPQPHQYVAGKNLDHFND